MITYQSLSLSTHMAIRNVILTFDLEPKPQKSFTYLLLEKVGKNEKQWQGMKYIAEFQCFINKKMVKYLNNTGKEIWEKFQHTKNDSDLVIELTNVKIHKEFSGPRFVEKEIFGGENDAAAPGSLLNKSLSGTDKNGNSVKSGLLVFKLDGYAIDVQNIIYKYPRTKRHSKIKGKNTLIKKENEQKRSKKRKTHEQV
jgi:hypothetical protein